MNTPTSAEYKITAQIHKDLRNGQVRVTDICREGVQVQPGLKKDTVVIQCRTAEHHERVKRALEAVGFEIISKKTE